MTTFKNKPPVTPAFTLIELLSVIAIIGILAALIVTGAGYAVRASRLNRARTELSMIETALESYKAQYGTYPPDNVNNPAAPQLFYELAGTFLVTSNTGTAFLRIHGSESLWSADVTNIFGVGGFVNSSSIQNINNQSDVQQAAARDFLPSLQPSEYFLYRTNGENVAFLGLPITGPIEVPTVNNSVPQYNPFRYVATNPTNNPSTYDLWIELILQGKTNRISNWNPDTEIVH